MIRRRIVPAAALAAALAVPTAVVPSAVSGALPASAVVSAGVDQRADASLRAGRSLSVSPKNYVGGQALTWTGNVGAKGVRRIGLQLHIGREGDAWSPVPGFASKTKSDGSFSFVFPAPAMTNISYRVVAKKLKTPGVVFHAKSQDLTLALVGGDTQGLYGTVASATPFTLAVDTTPKIARRPDTDNLPAFQGRTVTLERRTASNTWAKVATAQVDKSGDAQFANLTEASKGVAVYRVRQENFVEGGNRIGWFPSFPYYVYVDQSAPARGSGTAYSANGGESGAASATALQKYGWPFGGKVLYDFGWLRGESLTSPPQKGSQQGAYFLDYANGTGRAATRNGGLEIVSGRVNDNGPYDFGTTYATIQRASQKYGRWELRMRSKVIERGQGDYKMVAQLVPASAAVDDCSRTITIAEVSGNGTKLSFGANAGKTKWRSQRTIPSLDTSAPAFAVEVAKGHITWFMNGKPIGVVRSGAAVSDQPMTLRVGLVGDPGGAEMNHTSLFHDWVRSYPIETGRQVAKGPSLKKGTLTGC